MGLLDFLLLGALINSCRSNRDSSNNHSLFSNNSYDRGYNDGYDDACMDHDNYDCQDCHDCYDNGYDYEDCDCGYDGDCNFDF
jgi:hypothetical protein